MSYLQCVQKYPCAPLRHLQGAGVKDGGQDVVVRGISDLLGSHEVRRR